MDPLHRPRGRLRWWIEGTLGCLSFFAGAAVVTVALLPMACGRGLARTLEERFAEEFAGSLEVGAARMPSVLGRQSLRGIVVRDVEGHEVARGSLELASVRDLVSGAEQGAPPVLELLLTSVDLVVGEDGRTGLGRALSPRDPGRPGAPLLLAGAPGEVRIELGDEPSLTLGDRTMIVVETSIGRLTWSRAGGDGPPLVLRDLRGRPAITVEEGRARLQVLLEGRVGAPAGSGPGVGGGRAALLVGAPDLAALLRGEEAELELALRLDGVAAELADLVLDSGGLVRRTSGGAPVDLLVESRRAGGIERLDVTVAAPGSELRLAARRAAGARVLEAGGDDALALRFVHGSPWAAELLGPRGLVPWIESLRMLEPPGEVAVLARGHRLEAGRLLEGELAVTAGAAEVLLAPAVRGALPGLPAGPLATQRLELALRVEGGLVRYPAAELVLAGGVLRAAGSYVPASGALELSLSWPDPAHGARLEGVVAAEGAPAGDAR